MNLFQKIIHKTIISVAAQIQGFITSQTYQIKQPDLSLRFWVSDLLGVARRVFKDLLEDLHQILPPRPRKQVTVVDHAIHVHHRCRLELPVVVDHLLVGCIHSQQDPLPHTPEKGCIGIHEPEVAHRTDDHGPHRVFLEADRRDVQTDKGAEEDSGFVEYVDEKRRKDSHQPHSFLMDHISSLWFDFFSSLFDFCSDLLNAFIGDVLYQKHAHIIDSIDVHQATHVTSLVGDKPTENEFAVHIRTLPENLSTGPDDEMSDRWPIALGVGLEILQQGIDPDLDVVVDYAVAGRLPVGEGEFPSDAKVFCPWVEVAHEAVDPHEACEPIDQPELAAQDVDD